MSSIQLCLKTRRGGGWTLYPQPKPRVIAFHSAGSVSVPVLGSSQPINSHSEAVSLPPYAEIPPDVGSFADAPPTLSSGVPDSNSPIQEIKQRAKRGASGLTPYGRQMLNDCAALIEDQADGRPVAMLTLTLPYNDKSILSEAAAKWSSIMRTYLQRLSRELKRHGLSGDYCFCTEWQRRGALHAHIIFVAGIYRGKTRGRDYPIQKEWYRDAWGSVLRCHLGNSPDLSASTRIEKVRYSVGAYLGKYIGKGERPRKRQSGAKAIAQTRNLESTDNVGCNEDGVIAQFPSAWWGASIALKNKAKALVRVWQITVQQPEYNGREPVQDMWVGPAQEIVDRLKCYRKPKLVLGGKVPRAFCGRFRMDGNWHQENVMSALGCSLQTYKEGISAMQQRAWEKLTKSKENYDLSQLPVHRKNYFANHREFSIPSLPYGCHTTRMQSASEVLPSWMEARNEFCHYKSYAGNGEMELHRLRTQWQAANPYNGVVQAEFAYSPSRIAQPEKPRLPQFLPTLPAKLQLMSESGSCTSKTGGVEPHTLQLSIFMSDHLTG